MIMVFFGPWLLCTFLLHENILFKIDVSYRYMKSRSVNLHSTSVGSLCIQVIKKVGAFSHAWHMKISEPVAIQYLLIPNNWKSAH